MMKYVFASLAVLLIVGTSALPLDVADDDEGTRALDRDFEDFYNLVPIDKLIKVIEDHVEDPEFQKTFEYLSTDEFHMLVYAVEDLPEFQKYVLFLQAAGYNAIREIRNLHYTFGMKDYVPPVPMNAGEVAEMKKGGGFDGYLDDMVAILPTEQLKELHQQKLKEGGAFAKYRNAVFSPKFASIRVALYNQQPFQVLLKEAKANGFDIIKAYTYRYKLFGFY